MESLILNALFRMSSSSELSVSTTPLAGVYDIITSLLQKKYYVLYLQYLSVIIERWLTLSKYMETTSRGPTSSEFATSLATHGLNPSGAVHWNLGWQELHRMSVERGEASLTTHGVLLATTGERTGRSPNDRFIVKESGLADVVLWGEVNKSTSPEVFDKLLAIKKHPETD